MGVFRTKNIVVQFVTKGVQKEITNSRINGTEPNDGSLYYLLRILCQRERITEQSCILK